LRKKTLRRDKRCDVAFLWMSSNTPRVLVGVDLNLANDFDNRSCNEGSGHGHRLSCNVLRVEHFELSDESWASVVSVALFFNNRSINASKKEKERKKEKDSPAWLPS
jgi:hypothetical protein